MGLLGDLLKNLLPIITLILGSALTYLFGKSLKEMSQH